MGYPTGPARNWADLTPLEAAHHPVLNQLAAGGICGIMDTIAAGIRPGSDTAHLALLGYDPRTYYTGRGPLECVGSGIPMEPGMIGFRCNYATLSPEGLVTDRRAGRIHDTAALSQAVQEGSISRSSAWSSCSGPGPGTGQPLPSKERDSATVSPQTTRKKITCPRSPSSRSGTGHRTKRPQKSVTSS